MSPLQTELQFFSCQKPEKASDFVCMFAPTSDRKLYGVLDVFSESQKKSFLLTFEPNSQRYYKKLRKEIRVLGPHSEIISCGFFC